MLKFGIITALDNMTSIVIQSLNKKTSVEIAEARDENGNVIELKAYSKEYSVDIRALVNADEFKTEAGQELTVGNQKFIIESTDQAENNSGWVEVSLTAKTADNAAITTYSAPHAQQG